MALSRLIALLVALAAPSLWAAASAVPATEPKQWSFGVKAPMVGDLYELRNLVNGQPLKAVKRSSNPQLGWGSGRLWEITPVTGNANVRDHRTKPVVSGQVYHLHYRGPRGTPRGYFGVGAANSGWAPALKPARYRLEIDPATGNTAIFSLDAGDYLIFSGSKVVAPASALVHSFSVWLTAQPPVQGFIPFVGRFGGGVNFSAVLTEVRNVPNGPPLFFIKPGFGSEQCGNPQAVIPLGGGAALTADQLKALYGSATPSLSTEIPFLVCATTNAHTVIVNIKYRDL